MLRFAVEAAGRATQGRGAPADAAPVQAGPTLSRSPGVCRRLALLPAPPRKHHGITAVAFRVQICFTRAR